jgi:hypothetical protein
MIQTRRRARGECGLPEQWIARHRYLIFALAILAGFAFGSLRWMSTPPHLGEIAFEQRWPPLESHPDLALSVVRQHEEARTTSPETGPEPDRAPDREPNPESISPVTPAAVAEDTVSPGSSDQVAPKGYVLYFNSPTHWTPVPLPDAIDEARAPHNRNIRAEIEQAAMLFDLDIRMMKAFARIESGYRPKATTGKYKCLFQLSDWEFRKYWQGDIYDIRDCSVAAARKLATESAQFEKDVGRRATATEIYCIHQQGYQGCSFHYAAPHQLAWKNMYLTAEGQERGEAWARKAIWGNVPSDIKHQIEGGVEALTSAQFIAIWTERVERFMARKSEPPTDYVEISSKSKSKSASKSATKSTSKAPKKLAAKAKKKPVAIRAANKKSKVKVASR